MNKRVTRRILLYAGLAISLGSGCGGGSAGFGPASNVSGGSRGALDLTLNFPPARTAKPGARTRAGGGFIPIGTRAVLVSVLDPNTGAALAPTQFVTAPLSRPGPIPTILSVQFNGIRVGAVKIQAAAYPDAAGKQTAIATGSATGQVSAGATSNVVVPFVLTLSKLVAGPASISVDPTQGNLHTAAVTATVADASNQTLQLPIYWLSQDPGIAQVTFDPANPGMATITGVAEGHTVVQLVEPNSGMTSSVDVSSQVD